MKIAALVIAIGDVQYKEDSLAVLRDFFNYNNIPLVVVENDISENYHKSHPSWLKTLCHSIIDADFIFCWDLDLLPVRRYDVMEMVTSLEKYHLGIECGLLYGFDRYYFGPEGKNFKYNGGLQLIPKKYQKDIEQIYRDFGYKDLNAWEQIPLNTWIEENDIPISVLRPEYNNSMDTGLSFYKYVRNKHYTFGAMDLYTRSRMIKEHREDYFKLVDENGD